ncbi:MAG: elongation factor P [Firmicutes bacterium]|nr:elongation factor P [Bacillota bacterium]
MISAGDFRNGITFEMENNVYQVVEFQHVKPGKGAAFVRTKLKDVINGSTIERTFRPSDKMPKAHIERNEMEYSYSDGGLFYFMNKETYELMPLDSEQLGDSLKFVKENDTVRILSYKGSVFGVEPPNFVELTVTETEPGFKGDTAQGATKPATVETGAVITVPLFINQGEKVRIDTRTGEYMERA